MLLNAIERASLMASERSRAVDFHFSSDTLLISAESPDIGNAHIKVPVDYEGKEEKVTFNPEYLTDMLQVVKRESVKIEYNERNTPCLFKSGKDFIYVVSPVVKDEATL